jgi:hypothetical protein
VSIDQIIGVVVVWQSVMPARRTMLMFGLVPCAFVLRRANSFPATYCMLVDMVAVYVMQVPVVDIANMIVVFDGLMSASSPMHVTVRFMCLAGHSLTPNIGSLILKTGIGICQ